MIFSGIACAMVILIYSPYRKVTGPPPPLGACQVKVREVNSVPEGLLCVTVAYDKECTVTKGPVCMKNNETVQGLMVA